MDPLTILSIAASTVQFLDFGTRLLTVAFDSRPNVSAARAEVNELFEDSQGLAARGRVIEEKADRLMNLKRPLSTTEATLLKESRRCVAASREISSTLGTHVRDQTKQSILDTIVDAFKLVWNEKSIKDSQKRLADAREKLMFAMVSDLW
jgi:CHASE3 domain sensor protein